MSQRTVTLNVKLRLFFAFFFYKNRFQPKWSDGGTSNRGTYKNLDRFIYKENFEKIYKKYHLPVDCILDLLQDVSSVVGLSLSHLLCLIKSSILFFFSFWAIQIIRHTQGRAGGRDSVTKWNKGREVVNQSVTWHFVAILVRKFTTRALKAMFL